MAISPRMSRNPVTPSAQPPSIGARPSSSRPSSVKNSMAASMSSTTMPTLSIRLTVMMSPWRLTAGISRGRRPTAECRSWGSRRQRIYTSLDDLVCANEYRLRHRQAEDLRGLEVDHEFEPGGLLYGKIRRLRASEDLVHQIRGSAIHLAEAGTIRHEASAVHELAHSIHRRERLSR